MKTTIEHVYAQALDLTPTDRAALVHRLLVEMEGPADEGVEQAWIEEVDRRLDTFERGETKAIPAEVVWKAIDERKRR